MSKQEEAVPTREESIEKLAELIKEVRIAMLTTIGTDGKLHSRPMATQETPFAGELLFLTSAESGKVDDIREDQEVNVTYSDAKHTYVAMTGHAVISNDRALITALWSPMYKAWFPEGANDPSIRVLRVQVKQAEYWANSSSAIVRNFEILARAATGGKTPVGDHARITL
jgi:general stress protein 26